MKKLLALFLISALLAGCGQPLTTNVDGVTRTYPTYGLFNEDTSRSSKMCYEVSAGNVVWSIILIETIIAPVYFIGFSLYNPVRPKGENNSCGPDNNF